jgi:RNA polymerase sigma-70 factor (sigma-E family)
MSPEHEREYVEYVTARTAHLRRLAYLLCGDEHRADDHVQQALVQLYVHWRRARAVEHLDRYVRKILIRVHLDERRRAWSKVRLVDVPPEVPQPAVGSEVEDRTVLRAALALVPPRQRAVLVLRFLCDLPVEEVAEALGCSTGTVKSQTSHGLAALRRLLGAPPVAVARGGAR